MPFVQVVMLYAMVLKQVELQWMTQKTRKLNLYCTQS